MGYWMPMQCQIIFFCSRYIFNFKSSPEISLPKHHGSTTFLNSWKNATSTFRSKGFRLTKTFCVIIISFNLVHNIYFFQFVIVQFFASSTHFLTTTQPLSAEAESTLSTAIRDTGIVCRMYVGGWVGRSLVHERIGDHNF